MSQNFPKLDISKLLSCKILCTEHAKLDGYIDHICSFPGCEFSKMVCPICKETDPEHYKQHMAYMKRPEDLKNTLMNENDEFHHIVNDSIITANEVLIAQLDNSLEKEKEKLDNFFKEISQKFINEVENMKVEIYTQIVKKYYSEIKEDFQDFYSEKYQKFHGNILVHFLNYHKISQNNEKISSKEFENMVNLIFNSRIVAIQLKNLKDEKVKSILQNLPKIENFNIDDFLKKITNIFTNSYKSLYYPISPSMSPIKTSPISLNPFNSIKRGCTFEEKTRNFDSDEEEFGLMINKTPEELSNKVKKYFFLVNRFFFIGLSRKLS